MSHEKFLFKYLSFWRQLELSSWNFCLHYYCRELLTEVIQLLRNTANSQVEQIIRVMKRWA